VWGISEFWQFWLYTHTYLQKLIYSLFISKTDFSYNFLLSKRLKPYLSLLKVSIYFEKTQRAHLKRPTGHAFEKTQRAHVKRSTGHAFEKTQRAHIQDLDNQAQRFEIIFEVQFT
jgi:hypothetical protein